MKKEKQMDRITTYPPLEGSVNTLGLFTTDPLGSYTGVPADKNDDPVQDADDL